MAKEKVGSGATSSALAKPGGSTLAPLAAPVDELTAAGVDFGLEEDGLEAIDREDIRIAAKVINMKGVDARGKKLPEDAYFDTIEESSKEAIDAAFIALHKSNLYSYYDNATSKTVRVCRSFDRVTGTMLETGEERPCAGCPDAQWRKREDGKPTRNCGPVYNMFALDRETSLPFVFRFKRTSLPVIKSYLQKHFIGRRVVGGKRGNYPLFGFQTKMSCRMSDDGKYALPVLERGPVLSAEEMAQHLDSLRFLRENMLKVVDATEEQAEARDTAIDTDGAAAAGADRYASEQGQDFNDAPSAA